MIRDVACVTCGAAFQSYMPAAKYCSRKCNDRACYWRNVESLRARARARARDYRLRVDVNARKRERYRASVRPKPRRVCVICSASFYSYKTKARYCGSKCSSEAERDVNLIRPDREGWKARKNAAVRAARASSPERAEKSRRRCREWKKKNKEKVKAYKASRPRWSGREYMNRRNAKQRQAYARLSEAEYQKIVDYNRQRRRANPELSAYNSWKQSVIRRLGLKALPKPEADRILEIMEAVRAFKRATRHISVNGEPMTTKALAEMLGVSPGRARRLAEASGLVLERIVPAR